MRKEILFLVLALFLISFIIALPNPSYSYCEEMGYTINDDYCDFGDGNNCSLTDFYDGSCGEEYVVDVECAEAGERRGIVKECCEGLDAIENYGDGEGNCSSRLIIGAYSLCSNCGNDVCEEWENDCSCPEDCENQTKEKNKLKIPNQECPDGCICRGSTIKCELENGGRTMTVYAGRSGNMIVQVKGVNMSTSVTLYKHEGEIVGVFKNKTKIIKVLPDHVQEKIRERIRTRLQNQTIELDEDGIYHIQGKKKARLFFLIPVRERVRMQIDSDTGEVIKVRNPWWGFLAKDIIEEENESEED